MQNRIGVPAQQINNHKTIIVCGPQSLVLPSPEFDNIRRHEATRVNRRTRGGDLFVFRAPYWPRTNVVVLSWNYLDSNMRLQVINFLKNNLGKQVVIYSHDNRTYVGVIRTPEGEFTETTSGMHSLKLELETE